MSASFTVSRAGSAAMAAPASAAASIVRSIVVALDERPRGVVNDHDVRVFRNGGKRVRDRVLPPGAARDHQSRARRVDMRYGGGCAA